LFIGVGEGQLLATKVPVTNGITGINIYGHEVPQVPGDDLQIARGADISFNEDTGEIRAAITGVLSEVTDTSVKVSAKHVISGDIDFATGNIDSKDTVLVSGSLKPGFKAVACGEMVVGKNVDSAQIVSGGNVVICGGVKGKGTTIKAEGDFDIPFIEHGLIVCKGSVRISREAYFTDIRCYRDTFCEGEVKVDKITFVS